jgi:dTDP-4-amino-4,6-dideoxygalactose transaminase
MLAKTKIYLSPPHMGGSEQNFVDAAFGTNWITSAGSNIDGFENDLQLYLGNSSYVTALSSGTAALHLALQLLNVGRGDEVLCQSFTFSASANPIIYQGATPVFVDSEFETWNMSPCLLEIAIKDRIEKYKKPKAIIAVHSYGMPYKANEINAIAQKYEIPVIEDAAESLGSLYMNQNCGTLSNFGVISFNGNKIITTSAGGALITKSNKLKDKTIFLSTQAKNHAPHYEHSFVGFNYRMSNVLAGIGRGQMEVLEDRVVARRQIFDFYKQNLSQYKSISFLEEPQGCFSNRWMTCIQTDAYNLREQIRLELLQNNIESRPLWKPLHLQQIFKDFLHFTDGTSEALFEKGLCLPSGSNLTRSDLDRIVDIVSNTPQL